MAQVQQALPSDRAPATGVPLLHVEHVTKQFGGVKALDDVRFDVMPGEVLCLAGENGCGKSTLIKIITGVYQPEPGAIMRFNGRDIDGLNPAAARNLGIQVIWQDLALFAELSVAENIGFERNLGQAPELVNYSAMRADAERILSRLGVSLDLDAVLRTLPIAQRQIVAVARALVTEAKLVFMDEPTASLSQAETDALLVIVRRLSAEGIAVVFVSHRLAEVLDVCSRVTVLRDGQARRHVSDRRHDPDPVDRADDRKDLRLRRQPPRPLRATPVVLEVEKLTRAGRYEDVSLDRPRRRDRRADRPPRLGPHGTGAEPVRHVRAEPRTSFVSTAGRSIQQQSRRDPLRRRLCLGRSPDARAPSTAVDRR